MVGLEKKWGLSVLCCPGACQNLELAIISTEERLECSQMLKTIPLVQQIAQMDWPKLFLKETEKVSGQVK